MCWWLSISGYNVCGPFRVFLGVSVFSLSTLNYEPRKRKIDWNCIVNITDHHKIDRSNDVRWPSPLHEFIAIIIKTGEITEPIAIHLFSFFWGRASESRLIVVLWINEFSGVKFITDSFAMIWLVFSSGNNNNSSKKSLRKF